MFKNKGFLYGLGLGLILGASLLQLMNLADKVSSANLPAQATIVPSLSPSPQLATFQPAATTKPMATVSAATVKPAATAAAPSVAKPAVSATAPSTVPVATATKPSAIATPASSPNPSANAAVTIKEGMNSSDVAALLFDQGIITDKDTFETALDNRQLDRVIQYGVYHFVPNASITDIINTITTVK